MKRLWLAGALLFMVAALCVVSATYQRQQVTLLIEQLDALETAYRADEKQKTLHLARQLTTDYTTRTNWFFFC